MLFDYYRDTLVAQSNKLTLDPLGEYLERLLKDKELLKRDEEDVRKQLITLSERSLIENRRNGLHMNLLLEKLGIDLNSPIVTSDEVKPLTVKSVKELSELANKLSKLTTLIKKDKITRALQYIDRETVKECLAVCRDEIAYDFQNSNNKKYRPTKQKLKDSALNILTQLEFIINKINRKKKLKQTDLLKDVLKPEFIEDIKSQLQEDIIRPLPYMSLTENDEMGKQLYNLKIPYNARSRLIQVTYQHSSNDNNIMGPIFYLQDDKEAGISDTFYKMFGFQSPKDLLDYIKNKIVLDLGSGGGYFAKIANKMKSGAHIISLDPANEDSSNHDRLIRSRAKNDIAELKSTPFKQLDKLDPHSLEGSWYQLPFKDESMEIVFSSYAFPKMAFSSANAKKGFEEIYRVLKAEGEVFLSPLLMTNSEDSDAIKNWAINIDVAKKAAIKAGFKEDNIQTLKFDEEYAGEPSFYCMRLKK